jgi:hypothetical protein
MTVERTHAGNQTRYALRDGAALVCVLTFGRLDQVTGAWREARTAAIFAPFIVSQPGGWPVV